jgi:hypothetical protein
VFLRRVYVDLLGRLPEPVESRAFYSDRRPARRAALVDALLEREEFPEYWSLKWCDVLRVKAEFPINLWPNAVQAYHGWVRDALRSRMPYDRFARALLTSSGSNFRVPPANFYRAVQGRDPPSLAAAVALTFMGSRFERWPEARRAGMAAFFSRVAYKKTAEWKEEIVLLDPAPKGPLDAVLPDGTAVRVGPDEDPRAVFADWLLRPGNPWFARAVANRVWSWLLGRGVVHEPDDLREDNPPSVPGLLTLLERELVLSDWDLRHLVRLIVNSRTYQRSPIPRSDRPEGRALFASYPVRRLDAEVLIDALCWIGGPGEDYWSSIPEPFTFLPGDLKTVNLADGSITSAFLEMFGRPARDTGLESERASQPSDAQLLYLRNSSDVQGRIGRSRRLRDLLQAARGNPGELVPLLYETILSRPPEPSEAAAAEGYFRGAGRNAAEGAADLAWALVNSKEFLFRH